MRVGRKRVERLMREAGIEGVGRRTRGKTTRRAARHAPAADLVERDFTADAPDQLWVADITYVPTWAGFLYLAVVLDVWRRRVVGSSMATTLHTKIVLDALEMAIRQRQPVAVVHHSEQGCQETSHEFGRRCRHRARVSWSSGVHGTGGTPTLASPPSPAAARGRQLEDPDGSETAPGALGSTARSSERRQGRR